MTSNTHKSTRPNRASALAPEGRRLTPTLKKRARLVASLLAGSWRSEPPRLELAEEELAEVSPLLVGSGAGPLGWWRVRRSRLRESYAAVALRESYLYHALQAALYEHRIARAFSLLRAAGVEPLLIKGWAVARHYPETALRPYGDIDLVVRPEQISTAKSTLGEATDLSNRVDLHHASVESDGRPLDEMFARSQALTLGGVEVRVPGDEDHLRVLCLHLLKHGAWRPQWLCDVAAVVESRRADFDWDRCLGGDVKAADRIACAVGVAHELLGAEVGETPVAARAGRLPRWLTPSVLRQWEMPYASEHEAPESMSRLLLRRPTSLLKALRRRWPDPVTATVRFDAAFDETPRLPFQIAGYASSGVRFVSRLPNLWRKSSG